MPPFTTPMAPVSCEGASAQTLVNNRSTSLKFDEHEPNERSAGIVEPRSAMPLLQIRLFGESVVMAAGRTVHRTRRPRLIALLTYLLLHRDRPVPRRRLAFTLWQDDVEGSAFANLRRHLHALVRSLPATRRDIPWLLVDTATVQWNPAADAWCDVIAYELMIEAGRFAEAVELQSADLLDECDDEWLLPHRERLHDLQVSALRRLVDMHRERHEHECAIAYAKRILELDPWNEDVMRELIELRCASGSRAVAMAEYRRFAERLRRDLGVEPVVTVASAFRSEVAVNAGGPSNIP